MRSITKIFILSILPYLVLTQGCSKQAADELPYYDTPDFTPVWLSSDELKNKEIHKIAEFSFTDQDGKAIGNESFKGKIYLANFFFTTCPGICPTMTRNLLKIQEQFKNDDEIKMISYSVMPWVDTVAALKNYEKTFGIQNGKWELVTGSTSKIYDLARKSYFAEEQTGYNLDSTEFLHTEHVLLIDREGHIRGVYNGTLALETERMIEDIKTLKKAS